MGIFERKERERQELQALILETAMTLFLDEGYANVTIRKIARQIEYSPATVYQYFKDREEIFDALRTMAFSRFYEQLTPLRDVHDPSQRLRMGGEVYIDFAINNPQYYDLMFIMRPPVQQETEGKESPAKKSYELLRQNIQDCIAAHQLRAGTDIDTAAFAMWSFIHGATSLLIRQRAGMIPAKDLRSTVDGALNFMLDQFTGEPR